MMMIRLSPRIARRIRSLAIIIIVIIGLIAAQSFLWRVARSMTVRLQDKRSQIQQVAELKERIDTTRSNYKMQQASLEQLTAVIPLNRDMIQILERLENVASRLDMGVDVVSIMEGEALGFVGRDSTVFPLTVSVTTSGSPSQLFDYIEAMEYVRELMQIKSLAITMGSGDLFDLDMAITFYLQQQDNGKR